MPEENLSPILSVVRVGVPRARGRARRRPRILFLDSQKFTRNAITSQLKRAQRVFEIVADDPQVVSECRIRERSDVDLVLLNVEGQDRRVADQVADVATRFKGIPLVLMARHSSPEIAHCALRHGIRGLVTTGMEERMIIEVLRLIRAGASFFPVEALTEGHSAGAAPGAEDSAAAPQAPPAVPHGASAHILEALQDLTPRQRQVLELLREGACNKSIARTLSISQHTVKIHVRRIMAKLGVSNRLEAALAAR